MGIPRILFWGTLSMIAPLPFDLLTLSEQFMCELFTGYAG